MAYITLMRGWCTWAWSSWQRGSHLVTLSVGCHVMPVSRDSMLHSRMNLQLSDSFKNLSPPSRSSPQLRLSSSAVRKICPPSALQDEKDLSTWFWQQGSQWCRHAMPRRSAIWIGTIWIRASWFGRSGSSACDVLTENNLWKLELDALAKPRTKDVKKS